VIVARRLELLRYFGALTIGSLERQFNRDGRRVPVLLDISGRDLLIATAPKTPHEVIATMTFPFHVSDFLGQIEIDRLAAETLAFR
jgi:hypothetical protein